MTLQAMLLLVMNNKELAVFILSTVASIVVSVGQNYANVKKEAIIHAENYLKEENPSGKIKMDFAVNYFYDKFLSKFIWGSLIELMIPRAKVIAMLQKQYDEMCQIGQKKTIELIESKLGN